MQEEARQGEAQDPGVAAQEQSNVSAPSEANPAAGSEGLVGQEEQAPPEQEAEVTFVAPEAAGSAPTEQGDAFDPSISMRAEDLADPTLVADPPLVERGGAEEATGPDPSTSDIGVLLDEPDPDSVDYSDPGQFNTGWAGPLGTPPPGTVEQEDAPPSDWEGRSEQAEPGAADRGDQQDSYWEDQQYSDREEQQDSYWEGPSEQAEAGADVAPPTLQDMIDPEWPVLENLSSQELLGVQEALSDPSTLSDPEVLAEMSPHQMQAMIQAFSGYLGASGSEQTDQQVGPLDPEAPAEQVDPGTDGEGGDPYGGGIPFLPDEDRDGVPDLGDPDSREQTGEWVTGVTGEDVWVPSGGDEGDDILEAPEETSSPPALEDMIDPEWPVLENLSSQELLEVQEVLRDPSSLSDPEVLNELSPDQMQAMVQAFSGYMSASGPEQTDQEVEPLDPEAPPLIEPDESYLPGEPGAAAPSPGLAEDIDPSWATTPHFGDEAAPVEGDLASDNWDDSGILGVGAGIGAGLGIGALFDDDAGGMIGGIAAGIADGNLEDVAGGLLNEGLDEVGEAWGVEGLGDIAAGIAGGDIEDVAVDLGLAAAEAAADAAGFGAAYDLAENIAEGDWEEIPGDAAGTWLGGVGQAFAGPVGGIVGSAVGDYIGDTVGDDIISVYDDLSEDIAEGDVLGVVEDLTIAPVVEAFESTVDLVEDVGGVVEDVGEAVGDVFDEIIPDIDIDVW